MAPKLLILPILPRLPLTLPSPTAPKLLILPDLPGDSRVKGNLGNLGKVGKISNFGAIVSDFSATSAYV